MTALNESEYLPIGEVLPEAKILPLPDGHEAVTVFVLAKTHNPDGDTQFEWCWRSPEDVNQEELLGALISQTDLLRQQMLRQWDVD